MISIANCIPAPSLKNAFVVVCLNRFQQIVSVHTFQAPSDQSKAAWLSKLREASNRWKKTLESTLLKSRVQHGQPNVAGSGQTPPSHPHSSHTSPPTSSLGGVSSPSRALPGVPPPSQAGPGSHDLRSRRGQILAGGMSSSGAAKMLRHSQSDRTSERSSSVGGPSVCPGASGGNGPRRSCE